MLGADSFYAYVVSEFQYCVYGGGGYVASLGIGSGDYVGSVYVSDE